MRDAPMPQLYQVTGRQLRPMVVISTYPWRTGRRRLIVDQYRRKSLLVKPHHICRERTGEDSQQTGHQLRGKNTINHVAAAAVALTLRLAHTIQHQFIGSLSYHLGYATHDIGNEGPGKRGNENTE